MDLLWKDFRFAIHSLRVNPGFALVSILTLALGIGATTAIFSVVNGVLLRPLPIEDPERVVYIGELERGGENRYTFTSPANFNEWSKETKFFSSAGATFDWEMNLTGHGEPSLVRAGLASAGLFETLGARPFLGRVITPADSPTVPIRSCSRMPTGGASSAAIGRSSASACSSMARA
jgi:putative ABC transport system permease protein